MEAVATAFKFLGWIVNLNGRRLERLSCMQTWKWVEIEYGSPMLTQPMAPRALRRTRQGKKFRPVYGYMGPGKAGYL